MRKKIISIFLILLLFVSGCSSGNLGETTLERDETIDSIWEAGTEENESVDRNGSAHISAEYYDRENIVDEKTSQKLTQELKVPGEDFSLIVTYDTGDYNSSSWKITEDKDIGVKVQTKNLPERTECLIDHVHYEISLKSMDGELNGIKQDEMDDTFHGVGQDGFYIDNNTMYYNIFAIEGYSEHLISGYSNCYYGSLNERRITENILRKHDTYAEKVTAVFDLNIKSSDEEKYHTVSVSSKFLIPLADYLGKSDIVTVITDANEFECCASNISVYDDGTATIYRTWSGRSYEVTIEKPLYTKKDDSGNVHWYIEVTDTKELDKFLSR